MSSSSRAKGNWPASISANTRSSPVLILRASSLLMMPWAASMAACTLEARTSKGANALSKSMEVFMSSSTSAADISKRPPHILLAGLSVTGQVLLKLEQHREPQTMTDGERPGSKLPARTAALVALVAASVGVAAIYVTLGHSDNAARAPAGVAVAEGQGSAPANAAGDGRSAPGQSELAAFVFRKEPEALPEIKFLDADGRERTLADWRGKTVLLNLWATWCLPCRKEMPALDRLQATLGSDQIQVVAISVDRTGLTGAKKFLEETKTPNLGVYADPTARLASTLRAAGLPATLLIDKEGRELGRLLGPAEWDGEAARRLIQSALR